MFFVAILAYYMKSAGQMKVFQEYHAEGYM